MHRTTKIAAKTAATAALGAIALFATATGASAATVTNGTGFIGKGEVQSAFTMNNSALQKAVDANAFTFRAEQPTTQSLSQAVTQAGTQDGSQAGTQDVTQHAIQSATQVVSQDLTCTFTNGNGTKVFHRDGVRDGSRDGSRNGSREGVRTGTRTGERDGTRTGTQAGTQSGSLAADIDAKARKTGQWTGWNVNGWKVAPTYTQVGGPQWNAPGYGDWDFEVVDAEYSFGAYTFGDANFGDAVYIFAPDYTFEPVTGAEWGEWDALPGENPDDCLRSQNADHITQISNVVTPGTITDGDITDGDITDGATHDGDITDGAIHEGTVTPIDPVSTGTVTTSGLSKVFVTYNGTTKGL